MIESKSVSEGKMILVTAHVHVGQNDFSPLSLLGAPPNEGVGDTFLGGVVMFELHNSRCFYTSTYI